MSEHPIQGLMKTAMENIKEMVDVNTIIGDPVETPDGSVILPISKVGFGFAAGGSEFSNPKDQNNQSNGNDQNSGNDNKLPFGGGSGGGVSITPIAFLLVSPTTGVKLMNVDRSTHLYDRLIDLAPGLVEKIQEMTKKKDQGKNESKLSDL